MREKRVSWILLLAAVGAIALTAIVLFAAGVLRPSVSMQQPRVIEQTLPQSVDISISLTASPSPVPTPTPVPTAPAYPQNAVALYVNGTALMALSNRESAQQMLSEYLSICAYENLAENERLIRAYFDATLSLGQVDGIVEYLPYEEAKTRLLSNRTLLPVVRTIERVTYEVGEVETAAADQPALPVGTRLYRSLGKAEHRLSLSETIWKSGIAVSESQTLASKRIGSDPSGIVIENGTAKMPNEETIEAGGPKGKDAGELHLMAPCRGEILYRFGMRNGVMHYGIDYALLPGSAILAPESGTVVFCGERGDYGFVIEIRHGNGFVSRLTHCASPSVELDKHVYRGDQVALLACDETESEPHLHYELLIDNIPYNPLQYLQ